MKARGLNIEDGNFDIDAREPGDLEELALAVDLHVQRNDACGAVTADQAISDLQPSAHASKLDVEQVGIHEMEDTIRLERFTMAISVRLQAH
jgi:hypothetical protein